MLEHMVIWVGCAATILCTSVWVAWLAMGVGSTGSDADRR